MPIRGRNARLAARILPVALLLAMLAGAVAYNHYSLLATILEGWKLGCLANTCDAANVPPMGDLVGPRG